MKDIRQVSITKQKRSDLFVEHGVQGLPVLGADKVPELGVLGRLVEEEPLALGVDNHLLHTRTARARIVSVVHDPNRALSQRIFQGLPLEAASKSKIDGNDYRP